MRNLLLSTNGIFLIIIAYSFVLSGCGSSKEGLVIPQDLPEICRGIDFNDQVDMREVCGVTTISSHRKGYQNRPQTRYLNLPKSAQLVKKDDNIELRIPNTLPIDMPSDFAHRIEWTEYVRQEYIKTQMMYKEFRDSDQRRVKMFKLSIPMKDESVEDFCFQVPIIEPKTKRSGTTRGNSLNKLNCCQFDELVKEHLSNN